MLEIQLFSLIFCIFFIVNVDSKLSDSQWQVNSGFECNQNDSTKCGELKKWCLHVNGTKTQKINWFFPFDFWFFCDQQVSKVVNLLWHIVAEPANSSNWEVSINNCHPITTLIWHYMYAVTVIVILFYRLCRHRKMITMRLVSMRFGLYGWMKYYESTHSLITMRVHFFFSFLFCLLAYRFFLFLVLMFIHPYAKWSDGMTKIR